MRDWREDTSALSRPTHVLTKVQLLIDRSPLAVIASLSSGDYAEFGIIGTIPVKVDISRQIPNWS